MSVLIIAEAGVNHNGDIDLACELIRQAALCGADIVKFQTFKPEHLVSKFAQKAEYQKQTTDINESQFIMLSKLALPHDAYPRLLECCKHNNIQFLSTAFDFESINFLKSLQMPCWKIPSGEVTNLPYLIKIAQTGDKIILSSGMCTMDELIAAIDVLREYGANEIVVLQCTSEYPAPFEDVNLKAMRTIQNKLNLPVGYSDHTVGIEVPIAAVAMGAVVIEKHFTLDKGMKGPDHKASLEPAELRNMIEAIRNIEKAIGTGEKIPTNSEIKNIAIARKSIVASRNISKSEVLSGSNLTVKRPGNGISPMKWFEVLGARAIRNYLEDELIEL